MHKSLPRFKLGAKIIFMMMICVACDQKSNGIENSILDTDTLPKSASTYTLKVDVSSASALSDSLWLKSQERLDTIYAKAYELQEAISLLLTNPDVDSLIFAQQKWQAAMLAYEELSPLLYLEHQKTGPNKDIDQKITAGQSHNSLTASYLKLDHAIADESHIENILDLDDARKKIAAWPIQPGYLDSFGPHIHSGIVNDITLLIEPHTLRSQHLVTDREEVTLGLYAIEYLLFGDKDYTNKINTSFKRFVSVTTLPESLAQAGLNIGELPNNRRRALIELQSRLLVNDINMLISFYQTDGALMTAFKKLSALEKLQAFKRSVARSLQKSQALFTYFDSDLSKAGAATSREDILNSADQNNDPDFFDNTETDAFSRRFVINRMLALKSNLATIKPFFAYAPVDQKTPEGAVQAGQTLATALLADDDKKIVFDLLEGIEKEIAQSDYSIKSVVNKLKAVASILSA